MGISFDPRYTGEHEWDCSYILFDECGGGEVDLSALYSLLCSSPGEIAVKTVAGKRG